MVSGDGADVLSSENDLSGAPQPIFKESMAFLAECTACCFCDPPGSLHNSPEIAAVRSNVREFSDESFTVWRCGRCRSLHSREAIDPERYYAHYPIHQHEESLIANAAMSARLRELVSLGLREDSTILDYGCGGGPFVKFLRHRGFARIQGYDPFVPTFSDRAVLMKKYNFVLAQDVI